jgi:hypothetical protein
VASASAASTTTAAAALLFAKRRSGEGTGRSYALGIQSDI